MTETNETRAFKNLPIGALSHCTKVEALAYGVEYDLPGIDSKKALLDLEASWRLTVATTKAAKKGTPASTVKEDAYKALVVTVNGGMDSRFTALGKVNRYNTTSKKGQSGEKLVGPSYGTVDMPVETYTKIRPGVSPDYHNAQWSNDKQGPGSGFRKFGVYCQVHRVADPVINTKTHKSPLGVEEEVEVESPDRKYFSSGWATRIESVTLYVPVKLVESILADNDTDTEGQ